MEREVQAEKNRGNVILNYTQKDSRYMGPSASSGSLSKSVLVDGS
jgi:hypothetical protein